MLFKPLVVLLAVVAGAAAHAAVCTARDAIKMAPLASNPNTAPCKDDSGFSLIPPTGVPDDDRLVKMCKSSACRSLMEFTRGSNLPNCDLQYMSIVLNVAQFANSFDGNCGRLVRARTLKQFPPC